jgi:transcriptional regulator with XRE-family HTH domain
MTKSKTAKILGSNIKLLRLQSNLSQEKLAELIGVHRSQISNWEAGSTFPTGVNIDKLISIFGISLSDFFQTDKDIEIQQKIPTKKITLREALEVVNKYSGGISIKKKV